MVPSGRKNRLSLAGSNSRFLAATFARGKNKNGKGGKGYIQALPLSTGSGGKPSQRWAKSRKRRGKASYEGGPRNGERGGSTSKQHPIKGRFIQPQTEGAQSNDRQKMKTKVDYPDCREPVMAALDYLWDPFRRGVQGEPQAKEFGGVKKPQRTRALLQK